MTADAPKLTGDEYMQVLLDRQAEWIAAQPARQAADAQIERIKREYPDANPCLKPGWEAPVPLLEWFVRPGDEDLVDLPESKPEPKRTPKPRVYRSAESLREERDRLQARRSVIVADDGGDMAEVNLSPSSRSRAARNAGRRRFAKLDRDLERYATLTRRIDSLNFRIARAEAREERAALSNQPKEN